MISKNQFISQFIEYDAIDAYSVAAFTSGAGHRQ